MKNITLFIAILVTLLFTFSDSYAQDSPSCRLMGCVHNGNEAVIILSLDNPNASISKFSIDKSGLHGLKVESYNGRVFTDISCYCDSKCVTDDTKGVPFNIYPGKNNFITVVISDFPQEINKISKFSLKLTNTNEKSQLYSFSDIDIMAEAITMPD